MIYLNNAAVTVQKPIGKHDSCPHQTQEACKDKIRKLFNVKEEHQVFLTSCGKNALETMIKSCLKPGDHVVTTVTEYEPCLSLIEDLEKTYIGVNPYGVLNYDEIEEAINENTKAIVCCHGSNVTGNVLDLERICTIARRHKILVLVDGAQTAGAIPVDFSQLGIDAYAFTGQKKLMGPVGTGGLICKKDLIIDEKYIKTPSEEKVDRLCYSLDFILEKGIYGIYMYPHRLAKRFFEGVKSMKGVTVYGNFGTGVKVPTVSINIEGYTPKEVEVLLRKKGIVVRAGLQNAPLLHKAIKTGSKGEEGAVRFSFGYFNTRREVNEAIWAIEELLGLDELYLLS